MSEVEVLSWDSQIEVDDNQTQAVFAPGVYGAYCVHAQQELAPANERNPEHPVMAMQWIVFDCDGHRIEVRDWLHLLGKAKWKVVELLTAIGQHKEGDKSVIPKWGQVQGSKCFLTIEVTERVSQRGTAFKVNRIGKYLPLSQQPTDEVKQLAKMIKAYQVMNTNDDDESLPF